MNAIIVKDEPRLAGQFFKEFCDCIGDYAALEPHYAAWVTLGEPDIVKQMTNYSKDVVRALGKLQQELRAKNPDIGMTQSEFDEIMQWWERETGGDLANRLNLLREDFQALLYCQSADKKGLEKWIEELSAVNQTSSQQDLAIAMAFNERVASLRHERGARYSPLLYDLYVQGADCTYWGQRSVMQNNFFSDVDPKNRTAAIEQYLTARALDIGIERVPVRIVRGI